ncbi:metalloprotease-like protein [Nonomuraea sp. WAC 01424]|uniref:neutral zinc metallopeptidase n=1 Tax=Nonomuraea sp. WAC 01424 TaxID=2203200 RepID=UPI000F77CA6E|nr:neutral zinc metallopeptidase [Nonomuraea sp. WAC 01424]RSM97608.1 metalloprotease-like protein [Nonomuraea sp. WAC 01424]
MYSPAPRGRAAFAVLALLAVLAVLTVVAAPAQAAAPKLGRSACPETPLSSGGIPRSREYLTAVVKCLDTSWRTYVERVGRTFRKPVVRYYDEPERRVCGIAWPEHAAAFYCIGRNTLVFPLTGGWIEGRTDLYPFKVAAHEYGHHVQSLLGVRKGADSRRYELQADCLSGAFLGSVWPSLSRTRQDWTALLDATRAAGDEGEEHSHGTGANRVHWLERGYRAVSPAACDTWSAPASKVS